MAERIYNGMIPLLADMVSATAGKEIGEKFRTGPLGTKPYDEELPCSPRENMKLLLDQGSERLS